MRHKNASEKARTTMSYEYRSSSIREAAKSCAAGMLPDASVIGRDEDPREAAEELVNFWKSECTREGHSPWGEELAELGFELEALDAVESRIRAAR